MESTQPDLTQEHGGGTATLVPAGKSSEQLRWETPRMEDVSEQVMAQPYIRFT